MCRLQHVLLLLPIFSSYITPGPLPRYPLTLEETDTDVFGVRTLRSLGVDTCVGVYLCWGCLHARACKRRAEDSL